MALHERATHIQSIIDRMNNLIRFSKSPRMEKLRLPKNLPSGPLCNPAKSQRLPPITPRSIKLKQSHSKIHKELKAHESLESLKDTVLPIVIVN
uniref:Uncharacterized protein n=1 Tax=Ciona savignyi TaxID=51511 RepID=H2YLG9_CIOSA